MNEPSLPPVIDHRWDTPPPVPLGSGPGENEPLTRPAQTIEAMLRQPRRLIHQLRQNAAARVIGHLVVISLFCAAIYGVIVGSFSGGDQLWAVPVKLALGLLGAGLICLPSLYIFSCLAGARARLIEVAGLVAGLVMLLTLLLIGFAPVAWVFAQSTNSVPTMGILHLLFGAVALIFGLRFLSHGFRCLETSSHAGLKIWMIIFTMVLLQMTTALRPFIGRADSFMPKEKKFFLTHWAEQMSGRTNHVSLLDD